MPGYGQTFMLGMALRSVSTSRAALIILAWISIALGPLCAQHTLDPYQQTVLIIQQHIEENDLETARALITKALTQFPTAGGLENLLGVVEIKEGNTDRARQAFSQAIQDSPRLVGAYLNLGRIYIEKAAEDGSGQAKALDLYERVLRLEPANPEANYQAATLLMWSQSYKSSLEHLAKLSAEAREKVSVESLICADEAALGNKDAADRAGALMAANVDLTEQDVVAIAPVLLVARRADLVETILAAADERQPLSASGLRTLGLAQEAEGKLGPAHGTLEKAYATASSVVTLIDLARVAEGSKDYLGALGYLAHARDLQPQDASIHYEFGVICVRLNLIGEARKAMGEAIKLAPDDPNYNLGLGTVAAFAHDPTDALPYLHKYHSMRPADVEGILALGRAYFRAKDFESAAQWLKQAASAARTAAAAHYYLGRIAREKGQLEAAVAELSESEALKPDQPEVLAELGQIYVQMKKYADGGKLLDRAVALDADSYAANFGLLQLYALTGDARREEQEKRFDAVKDRNEEQTREMMRVIEINP